MSLPHRLVLFLSPAPILAALAATSLAQEATTGPSLTVPPRAQATATRTGARRSVIVTAVDRVKGAVVNIHSERTVSSGGDLYALAPSQNRVNGMGTGIVIDPRGYIVTNHHVVEDVSVLRIRLADGTTRNAMVVARSPEVDLALLKIDAPRPLPVMPLGTADDVMVGETVIAVGNAYGYEHTVSTGIVSAVKRDVSLNKDMAYKALIQTDASINPGNSGGPLVNVHGELVGVNVAIRAGAQGIGFAIPVDHMIRTVADMLGQRRRPFTYDGLTVRDRLTDTGDGLARSVVVERVDAQSPAAQAGFRVGDEIVQAGDVTVACGYDLERGLLDRRAGDSLGFVVRRSARDHKLQITLAAGERNLARPASETRSSGDVVWTKLGIHLAPVAGEHVQRHNKQLQGGLEVTSLDAEGAAARAGIKKGDILVGLHQWETVSLENVIFVLNHPDLPTFNPLSFYVLRGGQVRRGAIPQVN
jgi:serine protease Do